jgi:hypothetical protein
MVYALLGGQEARHRRAHPADPGTYSYCMGKD